MITEYCLKALEKAQYRQIDDESWFADIPGFTGVWANGASVEDCRKELIEVLEEWLILKLRDKEQVPVLDGLKIEINEVAVA